jgi:hypothetical protein
MLTIGRPTFRTGPISYSAGKIKAHHSVILAFTADDWPFSGCSPVKASSSSVCGRWTIFLPERSQELLLASPMALVECVQAAGVIDSRRTKSSEESGFPVSRFLSTEAWNAMSVSCGFASGLTKSRAGPPQQENCTRSARISNATRWAATDQ